MIRQIFTWVYYRLGWSVVGSMPPLKKYLVAVAPHTHWMDFVIGMLARSVIKMERARFLGKSQLFRPPIGWFFRMLGGTPVDRSSSNDVVEQVVKLFNDHEEFVLALAPEGTRKKVEKLRTGFYFIAKGAGVPIVTVGFDFEKKQVVIGAPVHLTGDYEKDIDQLLNFYRNIKGKIPSLGL